MTVTFSPRAWYEYTGWQLEDKKTLKRINALIKDIERNGNSGIGNPEPLRIISHKGDSTLYAKRNLLIYLLTLLCERILFPYLRICNPLKSTPLILLPVRRVPSISLTPIGSSLQNLDHAPQHKDRLVCSRNEPPTEIRQTPFCRNQGFQ